jgi:hypothetical protein
MEKLLITNNRTSVKFEIQSDDALSFFNSNYDDTKHIWGESARWLPLTEADEWELTQEDNRRVVEVGGIEVTEIHVPNDYTFTGPTDITDELSLAQDEESEFSRRIDGQRILSYLGVLINRAGYTSAQLVSIEAMPYVAETKSALIDGAFDYALYFITQVTPDLNLTQVLIDAVVARIAAVMAKYPDIYPA